MKTQSLIQIAGNILALLIPAYFLPGVTFSGSWWKLLIAGLILGLINMAVKPTIKAIWPNFIFVSLAIFTLLLNTSLLAFIALIVPQISISGFWPAFWGIIIVTLTNYSINTIINYK